MQDQAGRSDLVGQEVFVCVVDYSSDTSA